MTRHSWCQPGDDPVRRFVILFEDPEQGIAIFTTEDDAREYYERATTMWNCYLLAALPITPELRADPGNIPFPRNADEAKAMWLIGERWMRENAPDQLLQQQPIGTRPTGSTSAPHPVGTNR